MDKTRITKYYILRELLNIPPIFNDECVDQHTRYIFTHFWQSDRRRHKKISSRGGYIEVTGTEGYCPWRRLTLHMTNVRLENTEYLCCECLFYEPHVLVMNRMVQEVTPSGRYVVYCRICEEAWVGDVAKFWALTSAGKARWNELNED
jgi:hypothetical protein